MTSQIVERTWYGWGTNAIMFSLLVIYAFFLGYVKHVIEEESDSLTRKEGEKE